MARKLSLEQYIKKLGKIQKKELPKAINMTLNFTAFDVRERAMKIIPTKMTVRQKRTVSGVSVLQAKRNVPIDQMQSETGTRMPYMELQETGGKIRGNGKRLPIPTDKSRTSGLRTKKIRPALRMNRLGKIQKAGRGSKNQPFFMKLRHKKSIFRRVGRKLVMIRSLNKTSAFVKPTNWLSEAVMQKAGVKDFERRFIAVASKIVK